MYIYIYIYIYIHRERERDRERERERDIYIYYIYVYIIYSFLSNTFTYISVFELSAEHLSTWQLPDVPGNGWMETAAPRACCQSLAPGARRRRSVPWDLADGRKIDGAVHGKMHCETDASIWNRPNSYHIWSRNLVRKSGVRKSSIFSWRKSKDPRHRDAWWGTTGANIQMLQNDV